MRMVVIDGQGGRMGAQLIEGVRAAGFPCDVTAIGTNVLATSAMLKAGADRGATGENPVIVACRDAEVIVGPIGIISANALLGEITPKMAAAVSESRAKKILVPVNRCAITVVGVGEKTLSEYVRDAAAAVAAATRRCEVAGGNVPQRSRRRKIVKPARDANPSCIFVLSL